MINTKIYYYKLINYHSKTSTFRNWSELMIKLVLGIIVLGTIIFLCTGFLPLHKTKMTSDTIHIFSSFLTTLYALLWLVTFIVTKEWGLCTFHEVDSWYIPYFSKDIMSVLSNKYVSWLISLSYNSKYIWFEDLRIKNI